MKVNSIAMLFKYMRTPGCSFEDRKNVHLHYKRYMEIVKAEMAFAQDMMMREQPTYQDVKPNYQGIEYINESSSSNDECVNSSRSTSKLPSFDDLLCNNGKLPKKNG
jgi:hypothetical protein